MSRTREEYINLEVGQFTRFILFLYLLDTDDKAKFKRAYKVLTYYPENSYENEIWAKTITNKVFTNRKLVWRKK